MELTEHLAELRIRIMRVLFTLIPVFILVFLFSKDFIKFFWFFNFPPYVFSPLEWLILQLSLSLTISMIIIYPYLFFELYQFAKPGLYENERKFLKILVIPSYLLFLFGFIFSMKFLVPLIYSITLQYPYDPYLSASQTLGNAVKLSVAVGLFTQIPLAILLLVKFKLVSYKTLKNLRIIIYFVAFMSFLNLTSDFGSLSIFAAFIFFILMFELGLFIVKIASSLNILKN
ncbi:MAG: twin-arginine translocase subunit TatC [Archaeoglobaceae archaeon]|nr:twin-arginine translocase subunit TatC [Archaeoglobaceae archaeon]MCX8151909.1 twin-arginine translocase subunit TatC [Archaeoglobaceae archaeon]MDW8013298.1 twin-arginine translocase subunit TatC [Archaeoglobaceae archaeon]